MHQQKFILGLTGKSQKSLAYMMSDIKLQIVGVPPYMWHFATQTAKNFLEEYPERVGGQAKTLTCRSGGYSWYAYRSKDAVLITGVLDDD